MTGRKELPSILPASGFAVHHALDAGVPISRLNASDTESPFWGVRSELGTVGDIPSMANAYFSRIGDLAVVSHISAALIWGVPLPPHLAHDRRIHVSVPPSTRAPKARGVAGHHVALHPMDVAMRLGVRTTTQTRTLCDLAGYLNEDDLLAVADYLIWRGRDADERCTLEQIGRAIDRHPTKRGMARLRKIAQIASDHSDSARESKIRYRILDAGLPAPDVNVDLFDRWGRFIARPDLSYPKFMMSLDYEGEHHLTNVVQWEKDIHRVPRLEDAGWHHTRISKSDVSNSDEFLSRLTRNLKDRGWTP
jgi:hypothetical protein